MNHETSNAPVRFETREAQQVAGLQITCHSSLLPGLIPPLWQTFMDHSEMIRHHLQATDIFNVCRKRDEEDTQCVCVPVSSAQEPPAGMVSFELPAQSYAVFQYTGTQAGIVARYQGIRRWLKEQADFYRTLPIPHAFPFERYSMPPKHTEDQLACEIYIPIEEVLPALRGLDDIDWSQIHACYGRGDAIEGLPLPGSEDEPDPQCIVSRWEPRLQITTIPDMLRHLTSEDAKLRQDAFCVLRSNLEHQYSLYSASAAAVPFLSKLLHEPAAPDKLELLRLLTLLARSYQVDHKPRRLRVPFGMDERLLKGFQSDAYWRERTYNVIREHIANYLPFLFSDDRQICVAALGLLGYFKDESTRIIPHLQALLETTTDEYVQAYTLYCLGALLSATDEATNLLLPYLDPDQPEGIRLIASIALCAAMQEHLSEDMLKCIHNTGVYPDVMSLEYYDMQEQQGYVDWLGRKARYFPAIMSVTTSENRFIPEPFRIPAQFKDLFENMPGMQFRAHAPHYPGWFDRDYAEDAGTMLLRFCFPTGSVPAQTCYHDLNERQQRLLAMLAEHEIFWPDEGPYILRRQLEEGFERIERELGSAMREQTRESFSSLRSSFQGNYEDELDVSDNVQLLRTLGLPDTQEALQGYVNN